MTARLLPLHGGSHGSHSESLAALPFFGAFLLLLIPLLALAGWYLWQQGKLALPKAGRSPEDEAKRILAERFARGDISSEEFLERSSTLNWTPGSESVPSRAPRNRRWRG